MPIIVSCKSLKSKPPPERLAPEGAALCRWRTRFSLICLTLLAVGLPLAAQDERINHFNSDILVQPDSAIVVTETIDVTSTGQQMKQVIYRDFPQLYHASSACASKPVFKVASVQRDGRPEP